MSPTPEANKKAKGAADDTSRSGLAESSPQIDVAARGILRLAPRLLTRGGVALVAKSARLVDDGECFLQGEWLLEHCHDDIGEALAAALRLSRLGPILDWEAGVKSPLTYVTLAEAIMPP